VKTKTIKESKKQTKAKKEDLYMHILAIETTGPHCSVAIIDEAGKVVEHPQRNHESPAVLDAPTNQLLTIADCN
jgi:hypothetical protein